MVISSEILKVILNIFDLRVRIPLALGGCVGLLLFIVEIGFGVMQQGLLTASKHKVNV